VPFALYDDDISGSGSAVLGGSSVFYVAWDVTSIGYQARNTGSLDELNFAGLGGFALGDSFSIVGGSAVDRWHEFHYFNVEFGLWTPEPSAVGGSFAVAIATRIRWSLSFGTTCHLYVYGDT
jgi:hypothetical protein